MEQAPLRVVAGALLRLHFAGFLSKYDGILQLRISVLIRIAPVLLKNSCKLRFFRDDYPMSPKATSNTAPIPDTWHHTRSNHADMTKHWYSSMPVLPFQYQ
jgi:hypothetical protein